ncbi:MAG: lipoprotein signal peptidase [Bacteroidaceae bacterium]|jgi:signal peptidase II|nr:lipoprotein signal peptidase [Bacteroidaceae bacterium]
MTKQRKQIITAASITLAAIIIDQIIKILVKTNMFMHEVIEITPWFKILFTENSGMAFGIELVDKIFLTSFRLVAVSFLIYIIGSIIKRGINTGFLICMSLILAGATGNIIDCLFYGMIFNNPPAPIVAEFVPFGSGYASMFYGKVVDMFYFPLVEWNWPSWLPYIGGEHFIFFSPIFNFADACISCSVIYMLLFYRKQLQNIMK